MPANLITNSRILLNGEALETFEAAFEAQIGNNNVTITRFQQHHAGFHDKYVSCRCGRRDHQLITKYSKASP